MVHNFGFANIHEIIQLCILVLLIRSHYNPKSTNIDYIE